METKKSKAINVFAYETKTNMENLLNAIGNIPNEMMDELSKQCIEPSGAQIWEYNGCDGAEGTEFILKITVPVSKTGKDTERFHFIDLKEYKYVETTYKGPYADFPKVYEKFMDEITQQGLTIDGSSREIYLNCDFVNQENCITNIQVGIQ